jgi:hypothetical protein
MSEQVNAYFMTKLNQIFGEVFRKYLPRCPNYRYWQDKKQNMYAWTTQKDSDGKFWAIFYRHYKTKRKWIPRKTMAFSTRWKAKNRAYNWYAKAAGKEPRNLHREKIWNSLGSGECDE